MHFDREELIRYRDRAVDSRRHAEVGDHLTACPDCRLRYENLLANTPASPAPDLALFESIEAGMAAWDRQEAAAAPQGQDMKQRVAREIIPFLGEHASRRLLNRVSADGQNLLSTIEPPLSRFLGERAAALLVSHVVDAAIMRL